MHIRACAVRPLAAEEIHLASSKPGTGKWCLTASYCYAKLQPGHSPIQHWSQRAAMKALMLPLAWGERVTHVVLRFFGCNVISWLLCIYLCSFVHTPAHSPHTVSIDQANGRDPIAHAPMCSHTALPMLAQPINAEVPPKISHNLIWRCVIT